MQNKYEILEIVGEGAYGIVMKCRNKDTGEIVAIKKFKDSEDEVVQKSMIRELKVLKKLKHDNIVLMKECFKKKGKLYLVFEYIERNLLQLLEENQNGLDQFLIKRIIYQLCKGLYCIHNSETLHRDIKPENILITDEYVVKICDFGFARSIPQKGGILTDYVATRWYRSPELLLGCTNYGKEVDYWAVGCIMGELTDGQPMFPGTNELNQISLIQNLLGSLPQSQLELFYSNPRYAGIKLENINKPETLDRRYMGKMSKVALSFLKALLRLDPRERISGIDIFMHPYFDDIRAEDSEFSQIKSSSRLQPQPQTIYKNILKNESTQVPPVNLNQNNNVSSITVKNNNTNKFHNSKTNFYPNYSKSPPKDIIQSNSNINNNNNYKQINLPLKMKIPLENPIPVNNNMTKTSYKTFYNIKDNKPDIYNFDISIHYEEKDKEVIKNETNNNLNKKKKNHGTNGNNLLIIDEEQESGKNKLKMNLNNQNNFSDHINNQNTQVPQHQNSLNTQAHLFSNLKINSNQMNETRYNKFKPDTGADFYEEEMASMTNINLYKKISPKNSNLHNMNTNPHILGKHNKLAINYNTIRMNIKEESPEQKGNSNFLPHITSFRGVDDNFSHNKKLKK